MANSYKNLTLSISLVLTSSIVLVGCNENDNDNSGAEKLISKTTVSSKTAADLLSTFQSQAPAAKNLVTKVACDVRIDKVRFTTTGPADEAIESTAAVYVPVGNAETCGANRPVLLYGHGTAVTKSYDMANLTDTSNEAYPNALMMAAMYAGQGYVVVAPNYIGYDNSSVDYTGYLVAEQQATEMQDAYQSAKNAIAKEDETKLGNKLFISGYSQGGHVALATARKFEQNGIPITAAAPMSGPYAMAAFGDAIFYGNVNIGGTVFGTLMAESYQKAYGNIFNQPSDIFNAKYQDAQASMPGTSTTEQLIFAGKIPATALFQSAPTGIAALEKISPASPRFSYGFDATNYLINSTYRAQYLADAIANPDGLVPDRLPLPLSNGATQHPFRQALVKNDLRSYTPSMPTLLCGGNQDPVVFFDPNTSTMAGLLKSQRANFAKVDIDITNQANRTEFTVFETNNLSEKVTSNLKTASTDIQNQFAVFFNNLTAPAYQQAYVASLQAGLTQEQAAAKGTEAAAFAVASNYHGAVAPFCSAASKVFFEQF